MKKYLVLIMVFSLPVYSGDVANDEDPGSPATRDAFASLVIDRSRSAVPLSGRN